MVTGLTDSKIHDLLNTMGVKRTVLESRYHKQLLSEIVRACFSTVFHNKHKQTVCKDAKKLEIEKFSPAKLHDRMMDRFRQSYKDACTTPVFNKEGQALEGTTVDNSVNVRFANHDIKSERGLSVWNWQLNLTYNGNHFDFMLPKNWRATVADEQIAVVDSKFITKSLKVEQDTIRNIPITIYAVVYAKRETNNGKDSNYSKNAKIFTKGHKGFVVKVGDATNPVALRLTDHYVQIRKIAQNSVTREFFKQLVANREEQE